MGATTQKVYQLQIDSSQAEQRMQEASKLLADLKSKAQAANAEQRETQQVYRENVAALKELTAEQKRLDAARDKAAPGEQFAKANTVAQQHLVTLKRLNTTVEESKLDYEAAKEAAVAAGAAVGKQATAVKDLAAGVKDYKTQAAAAAQEFAPGTFGAVSQEVDSLKARLLDLVPGSAEAAQAIQQLAEKSSALRQLANATNSANPRAQARAFGVLSGALLGLTSVAVTTLQVWGLSEQNAQKYGQAVNGVVGVLYSAEQVNKLLNGENLSLIKSIWSGAKAWLGFGASAEGAGVAATTAGRATKVAVASTGIGLLLLAVGALISLFMDWGSQVKSSESTFTQYKATVVGVFDGIVAAVKDYLKFLWQVATFNWSGAIATAQGAGRDIAQGYAAGRRGVIDEALRKEAEAAAKHYERLLKIEQASGVDTENMERELLRKKIAAQKKGSDEQRDAIMDLAVFDRATQQKTQAEQRASTMAHLQGLAGIEEAQGRDAFRRRMTAKDEQILQQQAVDAQAGRYETAALRQLWAEKQAMQDAYDKEQLEKRQAAILAGLNAEASLRRAKGRESYQQELAEAQKELEFLRSAAQVNQAAVIAQLGKIADIKAARQVELIERAHAAELAGLDASIALQNAKGEDAYQAQVAREEKQLQFLRSAGIVSLAALRAQLGKIAAMKAAQAVKEEKEEQAAELARQQAHINFLKASGQDTIQLELNLKATELNTLLNAAQKNSAAIIAKTGEIDALTEQQRVSTEAKKRARMLADFEDETSLAEKAGKDMLAVRIKFQQQLIELDKKDTSENGLAQLREDVQKLKEMQLEMNQRLPSLGADLLQKIFKVKPEDVELVRQAITQAVGMIADSAGQLANSLLEGAMQETEQALATAQQMLQDASQQLSQVQSQAEATAAKLEGSSGARRDYLLKKLQAERAETERLAAVKAKAAREEEAATKRKHELERTSAELTAASATVTNIASAASAVYSGVKVIEKGSENPFPANIIAIASGLAAVIAAVASARQLASAVKYQDGTGALGNDGVLRGPSHAGGGIQLFGRSGVHWGEAEGGEAVTPVDATAKNGPLLQMLRTVGRSRTLTLADIATIGQVRVVPPSKSYLAEGGLLNKGAAVGGGYASANALGVLSAKFDQQTALIARLVESADSTATNTARAAEHTAATAQHTADLKDKDPVVKWDFQAEQSRREVGEQLAQAESFLKG